MEHREEMWDYRGERCEEIWDNARDYYDDIFDDNWWGYPYGANPWWWWAPATIGAVGTWVDALTPEPYLRRLWRERGLPGRDGLCGQSACPRRAIHSADHRPCRKRRTTPAATAAATARTGRADRGATGCGMDAPRRLRARPGGEGRPGHVLPNLGEPRRHHQRRLQSTCSPTTRKPIAGQVDKATQRVAWRIGDNQDTIFETSRRQSHAGCRADRHSFWQGADTNVAPRPHAPTRTRGPAAKTPPGFENSTSAAEESKVVRA